MSLTSATARLILVRHGRASSGWDSHPDPDLDDVGRAQANAASDALAAVGPLALRTSPLRRCRQTALPLARRWDARAIVDPYVTELPSPQGVPMPERGAWLRDAIQGHWSDLGPRLLAYRARLVAHVASIERDTVIVSHFIAINALIGAATDDDRIVIASLDNCSRTTFDARHGNLRLVETGTEADTLIR
jgi:broad specificity phosphatase PhoE